MHTRFLPSNNECRLVQANTLALLGRLLKSSSNTESTAQPHGFSSSKPDAQVLAQRARITATVDAIVQEPKNPETKQPQRNSGSGIQLQSEDDWSEYVVKGDPLAGEAD